MAIIKPVYNTITDLNEAHYQILFCFYIYILTTKSSAMNTVITSIFFGGGGGRGNLSTLWQMTTDKFNHL